LPTSQPEVCQSPLRLREADSLRARAGALLRCERPVRGSRLATRTGFEGTNKEKLMQNVARIGRAVAAAVILVGASSVSAMSAAGQENRDPDQSGAPQDKSGA